MLSRVDVRRVVLIASWGSAAILWAFFLTTQQFLPMDTWLLDWHVYSAGARDFVNHELYSVPLVSSYRLPVDAFNYPPLSAIVAIPLLPLPDAVGGNAFVAVNVLAMAGACVLAASILGARQPWLWGGLGFLAYTIHPWFKLAFLGNNTPLVLFLVTAFAHQHLRGSQRNAGLLLGAAIGLKLWPLALVPLLLRERSWVALAYAFAVAAASGLVTLAWLGPEIVRPAIDALQTTAVIELDNPVFFVSWLRETQPWWPSWGGLVMAAILVLIPAKGRMGIALGILGGLAVVPNLWRTYVPTLAFAALLAVADLLRWRTGATADAVAPAARSDESVTSNATG
jgi:hypothetical protein